MEREGEMKTKFDVYLIVMLMLVILYVTIGYAMGHGDTEKFSALYREKHSAVVSIESRGGRGTGFYVEPHYLVTNNHLASLYNRETNPTQIYSVYVKGNSKPYAGVVVGTISKLDISVLYTGSYNGGGTYFKLSKEPVEIGDEIMSIGNPNGMVNRMSVGIVSINEEQSTLFTDLKHINLSIDVLKGASGSPILNVNGNVIGVLYALTIGTDSFASAIPISKVGKCIDLIIKKHKERTL